MSDDTTPVENDSQPPPVAAGQTGILTDPVDNITCKECGATIDVKGLAPFSKINCQACNANATVPVKLGNFLLLRLIGTGGMGGVYLGRDEQLGRNVAIKVMLQSLGDDPQFIETFRHEAQAVAKLNHANIAQIYSFGQEKGQPYIVMELVSGERVDELMERPGGLAKGLTLKIGLEIAQGLSAADEAGLVHGDIKPENILLDPKGNAKLVDFGLATVAHQNAGEGIWGTPYYIAPEKIRRQKLDARSDIYSLGATLYHMLTGQPPFEGETPVEVVKVRLDSPPPDPRDIVPDLPPIVSEIITRMLAVERTERYPNYRSLISDLRKAVDHYQTTNSSNLSSIGGGKSIRIKKKGGENKATLDTPSDTSTAGANKKIVIRKPGRSATQGATVKLSSSTSPNLLPEISEEEKAQKRARQQAKKRKALKIVFSIVLTLILIGSGIGFLQYRSKQQAVRREQIERMQAQQKTEEHTENIANYVQRIESILSQINPLKAAVQEIATEMDLSTERTVIQLPPGTTADDAGAFDFMEEASKQDELMAQRPGHKLVQEILSHHAKLQDFLNATKETLRLAQEQLALSQKSTRLTEMQAIQQKVEQLHGTASPTPENAQKLAQELQTAKAKLDDMKRRFDVEAQQRLAEEEYERQKQAQAEAEERARQEQREKEDREISLVPSMAMNVRGLVDANSFVEAYDQLKRNENDFTTEKGKQAFKQELERHRYLAAMKQNIISAIQKAPFPWGYGSGSMARDITGASVRGLRVQGSREIVSWDTIQPPQMLKLVDRYINARELPARERMEIAFGAAIYADLFGEAARERSRHYAARAMDMGISRRTFEEVLESRWHVVESTPDE